VLAGLETAAIADSRFLGVNVRLSTIDVPGSPNTSANGINNAGQIVGQFEDSPGTHGFLDVGGKRPQLGSPLRLAAARR
jgi:probable HAF family extracellular repeat protein